MGFGGFAAVDGDDGAVLAAEFGVQFADGGGLLGGRRTAWQWELHGGRLVRRTGAHRCEIVGLGFWGRNEGLRTGAHRCGAPFFDDGGDDGSGSGGGHVVCLDAVELGAVDVEEGASAGQQLGAAVFAAGGEGGGLGVDDLANDADGVVGFVSDEAHGWVLGGGQDVDLFAATDGKDAGEGVEAVGVDLGEFVDDEEDAFAGGGLVDAAAEFGGDEADGGAGGIGGVGGGEGVGKVGKG